MNGHVARTAPGSPERSPHAVIDFLCAGLIEVAESLVLEVPCAPLKAQTLTLHAVVTTAQDGGLTGQSANCECIL